MLFRFSKGLFLWMEDFRNFRSFDVNFGSFLNATELSLIIVGANCENRRRARASVA